MTRIWNKHKQTNASPKEKVFVALSGGVDSAVAASLLIEQGYEVVGAFMKCWSGDSGSSPCWIDDKRDAYRVAAQLHIPLIVLDFEEQYRTQIVTYLYDEYARGRTPNPDILCNKLIKFELFLQEAERLHFDYIATGHYARVQKNSQGNFELLKGVDSKKDQTYFLHQLNQRQLEKCKFPIGEMVKENTREYARQHHLCVAEKRSTRGICFVGKGTLQSVLKEHIPLRVGKVVSTKGKYICDHNGVAFFTIGQRHGFGIGGGRPYFVVAKDALTNTVTVTDDEHDSALFARSVTIKDMHWIGESASSEELIGHVRYQHAGVPISLEYRGTSMKVTFNEPVKAVPPGQFLVIYAGQMCLGGGIIESVSHLDNLEQSC